MKLHEPRADGLVSIHAVGTKTLDAEIILFESCNGLGFPCGVALLNAIDAVISPRPVTRESALCYVTFALC